MNRINLICIGVRNMEESLKFYKNIGFKTHEKGENLGIVFFDNQGSKLELFPIEELAKDINYDHPPALSTSGFSGITLACNCKSKAEVDSVMDQVRSSGGKIVKEPEIVSWGGYSGYFLDPNGVYWEVAYGENWVFDENDMLVIEED